MKRLLAFIEFLNEKIGFKFDVDNFDDRFKLQKYVFISKFLGMNFKYNYGVYIKGPYSRTLADNYYTLKSDITLDEEYEPYLRGFKKGKFVKVVEGKDDRWLEIAATLLSVYEDYKRIFKDGELEKRIIDTTSNIKSSADLIYIRNILAELKKLKVIEI